MARPTRLDLEGGWYHVLNRGIERPSIFKSSKCYSHFVELLSKLPKRFAVRIHGYVLMTNHYHLQIETPEANLSRAVQWLSGCLSWKQITEAVSAVWEQEWQTLSTAHGNAGRAVALYVARHHSDRTLRELAQLAGGMEYPATTMAIRRLEQRLRFDKDLAKKVQRVLRLL